MRWLDDLIGFFAIVFVAFLLIAGPVVLIASALLLPLLLPAALLLAVPFCMLIRLREWWHERTQ